MKIFLVTIIYICSSKIFFRPLRTPPGRNFLAEISANLRFWPKMGTFRPSWAGRVPWDPKSAQNAFYGFNSERQSTSTLDKTFFIEDSTSWDKVWFFSQYFAFSRQEIPKKTNFLRKKSVPKICRFVQSVRRIFSQNFLQIFSVDCHIWAKVLFSFL